MRSNTTTMGLYREQASVDPPRDHSLWSLMTAAALRRRGQPPSAGDGDGAPGDGCGCPTNSTTAEALEVWLAAVETELHTLQSDHREK